MAGVPLADALPSIEELDAMCERQTGRTLQDWDEYHRSQKSRALRQGKIRTDRPLRHHEVQMWIALYGFQPYHFEARQISCAAVRNFEPKFETPRDKRTGDIGHTVIRWFLIPDVVPA